MKAKTEVVEKIVNKTLVAKEMEDVTKAIEEIADQIKSISAAMRTIESGRLKRRAIMVLIKDICGLSLTDIGIVLRALTLLEKNYLK